MRCKFKTLNKTQCKRDAIKNRKFCWQHTKTKKHIGGKLKQNNSKTKQNGGDAKYKCIFNNTTNNCQNLSTNDLLKCNPYKSGQDIKNYKIFDCQNIDSSTNYLCNTLSSNQQNIPSYLCSPSVPITSSVPIISPNKEYYRKKINNIDIIIKKGDITKEPVDVIVNAANAKTLPGGGAGVSGAIYAAAGAELMENDRQKYGTLKDGQICTTNSYNLSKIGIKSVIHAVGPDLRNYNSVEQPQLLSDAYINSLIEASNRKYKSIAFPAISTGIFGYPVANAAKVISNTIHSFIYQNPTSSLKEIVLVLFDDNTTNIFIKAIDFKLPVTPSVNQPPQGGIITSVPVQTSQVNYYNEQKCKNNNKTNVKLTCKHPLCNALKDTCAFSASLIPLNKYNNKEWVLLLGRERDGTYQGKYNFFGGKGEDEGCYIKLARREFAEEAKMDLSETEFLKHFSDKNNNLRTLTHGPTPLFIGLFPGLSRTELRTKINSANANANLPWHLREMDDVEWIKLSVPTIQQGNDIMATTIDNNLVPISPYVNGVLKRIDPTKL